MFTIHTVQIRVSFHVVALWMVIFQIRKFLERWIASLFHKTYCGSDDEDTMIHSIEQGEDLDRQ